MFNLDDITNENTEDQNLKSPDHPCRMLLIRGSGSGKINTVLTLTKKQDFKKKLNDSKTFIEYSQCMDDVYNNIDDYKPSRKRKKLIVFDYIIADIMANKISSHN